jgi:hypothetical protein
MKCVIVTYYRALFKGNLNKLAYVCSAHFQSVYFNDVTYYRVVTGLEHRVRSKYREKERERQRQRETERQRELE